MAQANSDKPRVNAPGFNGTFLADLLSGCLMHEACGHQLYRAVAAKTKNPMLRAKYEEYGKQSERHAEILKQIIVEAGVEPTYLSGTAQRIEMQDTSLVNATMSDQGRDLLTQEMAMLDAVFVAEAVDHANWEALSKLSAQMPEGAFASALKRAVAEVEPQEDDHLSWARDTRMLLVNLLARSDAAEATVEKAEQMIAKLHEASSNVS